MFAEISQGVVVRLIEAEPAARCGLFYSVGPEVQLGWTCAPDGCLAPPEPDPNTSILEQISALEMLQSKRLDREYKIRKNAAIDRPGTPIHGMTLDEAYSYIDMQIMLLRARLTTFVGVNEFRDSGCPAGFDPERPVDATDGIAVVRTYPYPL